MNENSHKLIAQRIGLIGITDIASRLNALILMTILTKNLPIEDYGIWAQVWVTISFLVPLTSLGLGAASNRFLSGQRDRSVIGKGVSSIFILSLVASLLMSSFLYLLAGPVSSHMFGGYQAEQYVKLTALLVLVSGSMLPLDVYFETFQQIKKRSAFIVFGILLQIFLIGAAVKLGLGLDGALLAFLAVYIVLFILKIWAIVPQINLSLPSLALAKRYAVFGAPLVSASICSWIYNLSDRYVIGYFLGMDSVAVYNAAYNIGSILSFIYGPISVVLLPTFSKLYSDGEKGEVEKYLNYFSKFYIAAAIPSVVGLAVLSENLMVTLTTSEFLDAYRIIPIIALAVALLNYGNIHANVLILFKKTKLYGAISIVMAAINITTSVVMVNIIGIMGAAASTFFTFFLFSIVCSMLSSKELSYHMDFGFVAKSAASSGLMALVLILLNKYWVLGILPSIGLGACVYFVSLSMLRGFSQKEIELLKSFLRL